MKNKGLNEIKKELNWKERIIVYIFNKTFEKAYNLTRIIIINDILKQSH